MSIEFESICVEGGEIQLKEAEWEVKEGEIEHVLVPSNEVAVGQAFCPKPDACRLSERCTGKVMFAHGSESGFSKAIIHTIMLPVDDILNEGKDGNPFFAIYKTLKEVLR